MGKFEDLEKLEKLRQNGVITEQEFQTEKTKILNDNNTTMGNNVNFANTTNYTSTADYTNTTNYTNMANYANATNYTNTMNNSTSNKRETKAMVGFILGLCSILAWLIPLFGYPVTITGIVFSAMGMNSKSKDKALVGLILSIVFLVITFINSFIGAMMGCTSYYV